jgi:hypothetical protein
MQELDAVDWLDSRLIPILACDKPIHELVTVIIGERHGFLPTISESSVTASRCRVGSKPSVPFQ